MRSTRRWPRSATGPSVGVEVSGLEDGQLGHRRQPGARRSDSRQPHPARLDEVVGEGEGLAEAATVLTGRRIGEGPGELGRGTARCAAGPSPPSARWSRPTPRPWRGWSPPRSASRYAEARGEVQEIVDTCDFFLGEGRRLYGQTVPWEMPDKQLFTFRGRSARGHDHHGGQLPGRRAVLVHGARPAVRQHRGLEARRVLRGLPPASTSCSSRRGLPTACSTWCRPTARRPSPG